MARTLRFERGNSQKRELKEWWSVVLSDETVNVDRVYNPPALSTSLDVSYRPAHLSDR